MEIYQHLKTLFPSYSNRNSRSEAFHKKGVSETFKNSYFIQYHHATASVVRDHTFMASTKNDDFGT